MKKSGLKNEQFISELTISGSTAIRTKNEFGVHIFSGSVYDDGVISSTLVKPKYNQEEIIKSLDTNIIELIPFTPPVLEETVLRSIYNQALSQIDDLTVEVRRLNDVISGLESKITEVEIVSQSLRVELDGDKILIASLQNENQQLTQRIQSSIIDLQNSIQRATSEAIQRTSLTARNESLLQEIDSLRIELGETRERLDQAVKDLVRETTIGDELQRGAFGGDDITANPNITDASLPAITYRGRPRNNFSDGRFINGNSIDLFNPNSTSIVVNVSYSGFGNQRVFNNIPPITLSPNGRFSLKLIPNKSAIDNLKKNRDTADGGVIQFRTPNSSFTIPAEIQIQRGGSYRRPS
jgi:hypothetical protein